MRFQGQSLLLLERRDPGRNPGGLLKNSEGWANTSHTHPPSSLLASYYRLWKCQLFLHSFLKFRIAFWANSSQNFFHDTRNVSEEWLATYAFLSFWAVLGCAEDGCTRRDMQYPFLLRLKLVIPGRCSVIMWPRSHVRTKRLCLLAEGWGEPDFQLKTLSNVCIT